MDKLELYGLTNDPLDSFINWYVDASRAEQNAEAMTLATISESGRPDARVVLFKGMKNNALTFYTNYKSPKGHDLEIHPESCLVFYWHVTKRQVRLHGRVKKMDRVDSDRYFQSRDRDSQLASYISNQSSPIADKQELLDKLEKARQQFLNKEVTTPEHWGGYLFEPYEIEFFTYGEHRLNDRFLYTLDQSASKKGWSVSRIQP